METKIRGALFDKDGTLFDFAATWNAWAQSMLRDLAGGDVERAAYLGAQIGYDFHGQAFKRDSVVIAGTPGDIAAVLGREFPDQSEAEIADRFNAAATVAPQIEAVPLTPLIARLRELGLKLGVATNDAEAPARAHLAGVGHEGSFDFICGYDSGYGGKPAPGMCLGFASVVGLDPATVVMVGDSTHDLHAGRAAGMRTVAVLTGMAEAAELEPFADVVLPDIGHLPDWIAAQSGQ